MDLTDFTFLAANFNKQLLAPAPAPAAAALATAPALTVNVTQPLPTSEAIIDQQAGRDRDNLIDDLPGI